MIRYDRLTSRVETKSVFSKTNKWIPLRFNSLQQAKAVFHRQDLEEVAESVRQEIKEIKDDNDYQERIKQIDDDYQERIKQIDDDHRETMKQIDDDERTFETQITQMKVRQQQSEIDNLKRDLENIRRR